MYFCHSAEIWQQFPQLVPGLLLVDNLHPQVDVETLLKPWYQRARERLNQGPESQMPQVSAWRRAYTQMGLKPTKYRSAAEALLRRFKREDDLPRLHPLVDLCNALSLAFALPVAAFDLAYVAGYLEVRHATGTEQYLAFNGEIEMPPPDEVIFADAANQVHARRWTFRQSRRSIISPETTHALIVSEGLHETAAADVKALLEALAEGIATCWSPARQQTILTAQTPRLEFDLHL
jgi:DNA/RNA-binding domain of Phe-tRNA-synthetase-like protein